VRQTDGRTASLNVTHFGGGNIMMGNQFSERTVGLCRRGEGVPDESSGQRVSRHDDQGGQWTSMYELD